MDMATYRHAGHKKNIAANDFDGWPEERRNRMKLHLQCPVCRAPAHFRRRSRDGKDPCFVARHESGCPMASSSHYIAAAAAAVIEEVEQIVKDTSILEVDMGLPDRRSRPAGLPTRIAGEIETGEGRVRRQHTKKSTKPEKPSCVGGERLLLYLVCSPDFRQTDIKIRIPGMRNEFTASRLFRSFSDMAAPAEGTEGKWRGFWGRLTGSGADMEYLNTGGSDAARIIVVERIRNAVYGQWKITRRNVAGAYCLAFGKPKWSEDEGYAYIEVFSKDRIVLCPGKTSDITDKLDDVYAGADTLSSPDPGLQALQAHSLDILRKDDWT